MNLLTDLIQFDVDGELTEPAAGCQTRTRPVKLCP